MINDDSHQKEPNCDSEPPESEIHKTDESNTKPNKQKEDTDQPTWRGWHRKPEQFFAGCIAAFTLILTASAIYQACVMQRQLETMERTLTMEERAWVTIRQPMLQSPLTVGEIPGIYLRVQNSGRSPALKLRIRHTFGILNKLPDGPMPEEPIMGEESLSVIAPGEYMRSVGPLGSPLTEVDLARLKRAELSIFTYGTVTYFDIFDTKHRTTFCLILRDITKTDLSPCGKWNEAD